MKSVAIKIFINLIFILFCNLSFAQNDNSIFYTNKEILPSDSNKLILKVTNVNFIKNNEYFNEIVDGYTYIGYFIQPRLEYHPSYNTKIEGGIHILKFSGKDELTQILPLFTFSYKPVKNVTLLFGSIYGTVNHQLIEPIYQFDRYYDKNIENGIQLLFNNRYIQSDIWLNWEKFILKNDPFKEEFNVGGSVDLFLTNPLGKNRLYLPLQAIVAHKGGQIKDDDAPLQTIANTATGIAFEHVFNQSFLYSIGTENYYCTYNDLSHVNQYKYEQGWGESSNLYINSKYFYLMLGYWYGEYFIAPKGEPLFSSNSLKYNYYYDEYRNLVTGKFQIKKNITKGIELALRFESYYEYAKNDFDFSYSMNLIFNRDFFLKNITYKTN